MTHEELNKLEAIINDFITADDFLEKLFAGIRESLSREVCYKEQPIIEKGLMALKENLARIARRAYFDNANSKDEELTARLEKLANKV